MRSGLPGADDGPPAEGAAFRGVATTNRSRRMPALVIVGAVGVLAVALLTKGSPATVVTPTPGITPTGSLGVAVTSPPVASADASPASSPTPTPGAPALDPTVTPHPTFDVVPAVAGATKVVVYTPVTVRRQQPVRLTIDLPDGWEQAGPTMFVKAGGAPPGGASIGFWSLNRLFAFPCRWSTKAFVDPRLMDTPEGQALGLTQWWGQVPGAPPTSNSSLAPLASRRVETTFAGFPAWYVEELTRREFDFGACDGGQLVFWNTTTGAIRYGLGRGEQQRVWVVDVGGATLVIDAAAYDDTPAADQAELQAILDSVAIAPE